MSHAKEALTRNTALQPEPVKPELTLGDEEVSDVSLATFHVVDKENTTKPYWRRSANRARLLYWTHFTGNHYRASADAEHGGDRNAVRRPDLSRRSRDCNHHSHHRRHRRGFSGKVFGHQTSLKAEAC